MNQIADAVGVRPVHGFLRWVFLAVLAVVLASRPALATTLDGSIVRPDAPEAYEVVEGDTLWHIARTFLTEPWLWPDIWQVNPEIENPHLIYPGDVVYLRYRDGVPRLELDRGAAGRTLRLTPESATAATGGAGEAALPTEVTIPEVPALVQQGPLKPVKLRPKIRATPLVNPIPAIPLDGIGPFLLHNRIVTPDVLENAPYILAGEEGKVLMGITGEIIYARGILDKVEAGLVRKGDVLSVVRRGATYVDPDTNEFLGLEARSIGSARVMELDGNTAVLSVVEVTSDMRPDDRLLPTEQRALNSVFYPDRSERDLRGRIISVPDGVVNIGQYSVVVINLGERDGMVPGHIVSVLKQGPRLQDRIAGVSVRMPVSRAGLMMVFRAFERLSYGLVLELNQPVQVLDEVSNP